MPDDLSVADDVNLFRLVPIFDIDWDYDEQHWIVKSSAFNNTSGTDGMSVVLGDTLAAAGRAPRDANASMPERFVVAITAGEARAEDQAVERDPVDEELAHGEVRGDKGQKRRRRLRSRARWIVVPPPQPPEG